MAGARDLADRLLVAADLWETGVAIRRQSLRREYPAASEAAIDRLLTMWLQERPGAEAGDGPQGQS